MLCIVSSLDVVEVPRSQILVAAAAIDPQKGRFHGNRVLSAGTG